MGGQDSRRQVPVRRRADRLGGGAPRAGTREPGASRSARGADPRTPADEPEALITIPLIARDSIKGALNIYRLGEDASFDDDEFELAKRFGDAAALALDNAQVRARLEHQARRTR